MLKTNHVMVDLETMSTGSNAAIVAIGAVFLERTDVGTYLIKEEFYTRINLQSSIDAGLYVDGNTIKWWMMQPDEVRGEIYSAAQKDTLHRGLTSFSSWYEYRRGHDNNIFQPIWGNGTAFDNPILSNAYKVCDIELPWSHREDYCYRTLKNLYPEVTIIEHPSEDKAPLVKHNALDDAIYQGHHLGKLLNYHEAKGGTL